MTLALIPAVVLTACGGDDEADADLLRDARLEAQASFTGSGDRLDDTATARLVEASERLAVQLVAAAGGDDVVVSPLGLQLVLAVLREGADGLVAEEIDLVAGLDGSPAVADLRARMDDWAGDVSAVDRDAPPERPLVHLADAVVVQEGLEAGETFLDAAGRFHRAQVYETDLAGTEGQRLADAWVRRESGGLLERAPLEPDPGAVVRLMNVVVLAAAWATEFDPAATSDEPFTRADGSGVEVPTMHMLEAFAHAAGDGWQAVELPYTDGFSMRVVVADDGGPVDAARWVRADAGLDGGTRRVVRLAMPRWETDSTLQLGRSLTELGLGSLQAPAGGLDGVVPGAFVRDVAQAGTITVGERGTVAAVVTDLDMAGSMPPEPEVELALDRPFDYRVVEDATGLVLIAGRVADPS